MLSEGTPQQRSCSRVGSLVLLAVAALVLTVLALTEALNALT